MNTRTAMFAAPFVRTSRRFAGLLLAVACILLPALPGFSQPPIPIAALWCAYGWASDGDDGWRAPVALFLLGLAQDQMAGGPLGFYALIFVIAYVIGRLAARTMRGASLISPWIGFAATAAGACVAAGLIAATVLGSPLMSVRPFVVAALITAVLFPFVRPLYLRDGAGGALPSLRFASRDGA